MVEIYETSGDGDWTTSAAMCMECGHIWQAVYPVVCNPTKLQCSKCGKHNSITVTNDAH